MIYSFSDNFFRNTFNLKTILNVFVNLQPFHC